MTGSGEDTPGVSASAASEVATCPDEAGQNHHHDRSRELDGEREPGERAGGEREQGPRAFTVALSQQHAEGREREHRGEHVSEEHAPEGKEERAKAPEHGGQTPVAGRDAASRPADEQQEDEEGGDGRGAHPAVRAAAVCLVHAFRLRDRPKTADRIF